MFARRSMGNARIGLASVCHAGSHMPACLRVTNQSVHEYGEQIHLTQHVSGARYICTGRAVVQHLQVAPAILRGEFPH